MFMPGDFIFHAGHGICKVDDIQECRFGAQKEPEKYFQLQPIHDQYGTIIYSPISDTKTNRIRKPLTAEEANRLIDTLPTTDAIEIELTGNKMLDRDTMNKTFKSIRDSGDPNEYVRLMHTVYEKKYNPKVKERKKISEFETQIWHEVEKIFFEEIAFSLNIPEASVPDYIDARLGCKA